MREFIVVDSSWRVIFLSFFSICLELFCAPLDFRLKLPLLNIMMVGALAGTVRS